MDIELISSGFRIDVELIKSPNRPPGIAVSQRLNVAQLHN